MSSLQHNRNQRATIEQIVRQVLADLRSGQPSARPTASTAKPSVNAVPGQLTLTSKIVSASLLEGRLDGISQLVVPRGAVITPAARDELKRRNVTIASAVSLANTSSAASLHVAVAGTRYDARPLLSALAAEGIHAAQERASDLIEATTQLAPAARTGFALLVTDEAAAALCLANRHAGVRAVLATNATAVDAAVASVGPNLLVIAPTGRSVFEMKQTIRAWLRHGRPACPAVFRNHLG
jgi:hypothetical protein